MRLLLSRLAPAGAMLALAVAMTQSAPARQPLVAQSASVVDVAQFKSLPDPPRQVALDPSPAAVRPERIAAAPRPVRRPATPRRPGRVALGTGQWGLINQDRA